MRATAGRAGNGRRLVIIAGGSASGKTFVARAIQQALGETAVEVIPMDAYYRHRPDLTLEQRRLQDYDVPESIDFAELAAHLRLLKQGRPVRIPEFDFETFLRIGETTVVEPRSIIVLDGHLCLAIPEILSISDFGVYLDCPDSTRLERRVRRDRRERGRTVESIRSQWDQTVQPGHEAYVEPSKAAADVVVDSSGDPADTVRAVLNRLTVVTRASAGGGLRG